MRNTWNGWNHFYSVSASAHQLADSLTKNGVLSREIFNHMTGLMAFRAWSQIKTKKTVYVCKEFILHVLVSQTKNGTVVKDVLSK